MQQSVAVCRAVLPIRWFRWRPGDRVAAGENGTLHLSPSAFRRQVDNRALFAGRHGAPLSDGEKRKRVSPLEIAKRRMNPAGKGANRDCRLTERGREMQSGRDNSRTTGVIVDANERRATHRPSDYARQRRQFHCRLGYFFFSPPRLFKRLSQAQSHSITASSRESRPSARL